ncbi:hypothetical protein [Mesotoga sp. B105.6.4]|uniref:hypothetical protein n=1 Tax=Mesotoga sp. B105.6.4 TaxID=1582224 RepID=UPI000CCC52E5|nr:hypothetical protein [Mesotoga sp. B105.6.4]PNS36984.1 hypothetical protein RJ60_11580 [Mesotoga sp. B105.6.4]
MANRVCIRYKDFDLLRIIPFPAGSEYDFKISVVGNDYELRMYRMNKKCFWKPHDENFHLKDWEITYHNRKGDEPSKLHFKRLAEPHEYYDFPIVKMADPISSPEFPIPFLKIGVSRESTQLRKFRAKKNYTVIDIGSANVVELFIVNGDFDLEKFMRKWEMFDLLYTVVPIEYFVNGNLSKGFLGPKYEAIYSGNESLFRFKTMVNEQIGMMAVWYADNKIDGSKQRSFVSFYENQDYLRFMACAPVEYKYHNGSKSERKPAYKWQLERSQQRMDPAEYDNWKCYFEKLESENENSEILPDGFSLEVATHKDIMP